ncbi:MAG: ABC transporter permease [Candidatus Aminicenantes bacterium]|nr:ABC transporter permease [Candidatus Aminicenantes bacterium]
MSGTLDRIRPVVKKELRQIRRDPRTLVLLLAIPAFLLIMYGYALNFDVKHIKLVLCDQDQSRTSREFAGIFLGTEYFDLVGTIQDAAALDTLIDRGEARAGLVLPRGFGNDIAAGRSPAVQVLLDGSDPTTGATAIGYINTNALTYSVRVVTGRLDRLGISGTGLPIDLRPRVWYNPELRSVRFLIPGLMAFILMTVVVVSTAFSVVREKERGTMEQILVSPLRPLDLVAGKTIPYIFISIVSIHAVLFVAAFLFDVTIKGSYLWLLAVMLLFLIGGLGLGILISTIAQSQQVAFMMAILLTMLPTFILSGFVFPIRNMPAAIQAVTYLVPARYFLSALRAILLKGAGLGAFWDQLVGLLGFAALMIAAGAIRLRRGEG